MAGTATPPDRDLRRGKAERRRQHVVTEARRALHRSRVCSPQGCDCRNLRASRRRCSRRAIPTGSTPSGRRRSAP
ncbi:MAG: hypothetical protein ACOC35_00760 [Promethearchaeia archaeon]